MNSKRGILCPEQTECSCAFILHIATAAYTVPTAAVDTMVSIIFSCRHDSKQMCVSDCSTCELFSDRWVGNSQTGYCQQQVVRMENLYQGLAGEKKPFWSSKSARAPISGICSTTTCSIPPSTQWSIVVIPTMEPETGSCADFKQMCLVMLKK